MLARISNREQKYCSQLVMHLWMWPNWSTFKNVFMFIINFITTHFIMSTYSVGSFNVGVFDALPHLWYYNSFWLSRWLSKCCDQRVALEFEDIKIVGQNVKAAAYKCNRTENSQFWFGKKSHFIFGLKIGFWWKKNMQKNCDDYFRIKLTFPLMASLHFPQTVSD